MAGTARKESRTNCTFGSVLSSAFLVLDLIRVASRRAFERRTYVTHKPYCNDCNNKLQPFAFWSWCSFIPRAKNCAFIFLTHTQVRLFLTCVSPCVCSTRMRGLCCASRHAGEVAKQGDDTFLCECRLSSPRATDNFVEKVLYTSGGRNTGAVRKDGAILFGVSNAKLL